MKIGLTTLILPAEWDLDTTLNAVSDAGYTALELAVRDEGYCSIETAASDLSQIAARAEARGIEVTGICPAARSLPRDLMNSDEGVRTQSVATFFRMMDIADAIGVGTLLVVPGRLSREVCYDDAYRYALDGMRELAGRAEAMNIDLAIEYVWNDFLLSPMEFARFCDEIGSARVGFYFDSGNMVHTGYPEHWIRICAEHLMAVHFKDFRRSDRTWTPLLEGDVDFIAVMNELRRAGYDGHVISEVDPSIASLEATEEAIRNIASK